jgi:hypothetical protein
MNDAHIEFYHSAEVLKVARTLGRKPYEELSFRARQRRLDKAVQVVKKQLASDLKFYLLEKFRIKP